MNLNTKLTKNHFLAAFFPLLITFGLALFISWSSPGNTEGLPLLGLIVYLISFVYFCKMFGMTKRDVIGLTVFFVVILLVPSILFLGSVSILFLGGSGLVLTFFMLVSVLIGAIINGFIYAAIIYVLLAIFLGEPRGKKQ